jgi:hypothetical protein
MNMENIEKISLIDKTKLNAEFYFTSLLEEAYGHGTLSDIDIERIQITCLELLAYKTERYTGGESSSVRVEVAESIMKSNLYTIGLYLKSFPCPDDAVNILKEQSITDIYYNGRKRIEIKLKAAKYLHYLVLNNLIDTENHTYSSTVVDGIKGFFKIYDADYEAHEIHITCDYPVCNPITKFVGIEFIEKYLESIYYENMFSNRFSAKEVHHLLCGYDEHYEDLIFNLFEQILTCAIGCILAKTDITALNFSAIQVEYIYSILSEKSREEAEIIITDAYHRLIGEPGISNLGLQKYIKKAIPRIISNVITAVKNDKLERVFIQPKHPELNPKIAFSFGEKMDNEKYRSIINEIMQCRFTSDKITIIKNEIHTLSDLEDLFSDAELTAEETVEVLNELDIAEIAALAKQHPYKSEIEAVDLSESEIAFRFCLNNYISSLSQEKQAMISKAISMM